MVVLPMGMIKILTGLVFGIGVFLFFWKKLLLPMKFPVDVEIREKRGNSLIMKKDKARRRKMKTGEETYELMKAKTFIEPPKYSHYEINTKGKPILSLYSPTSNDYRPMKLDLLDIEGKGKLTIEDKGARFWFVQEHKRIREKYMKASWMERYAPYISMILLGTFGTIQLVIWAKSTGVMSEHLANAANSFAAASEAIRGAASNLATTAPPIG